MSLISGLRSGLRSGVISGLDPTDAAAPSFVDMGALASGTGALNPALPAGLATGDILILIVNNTFSTVTDATLTDAQSFVAIAGGSGNSGDFGGVKAHLTGFWRRYNGSGAAPTVADNGDFNCARIYAIRGCVASGDPWDYVAFDGDNDGDSTLTCATGGTTSGSNRFVMNFVVAFTQAAATLAGEACADLTSLTERDDTTTALAEDIHIAAYSGVKAQAGAVGDLTATWSGGTYWVSAAVGIAFKP